MGLAMVLLVTSRYGAGVSSDAGRNLSTAENLLRGKGFVDLAGAPFVWWPPLYPLVLAGLSVLTHRSVFQVAWYLNVWLHALNIALGGWWLSRVFKERPLYAALGALILALSRSTLRIYANVASEPLFATFMLIFFLQAASYLQSASRHALWWMFLVAGLAALQRYLGVFLIAVGGLVVIYKERRGGLVRAAFLSLLALLPLAAWVVFHNYPVSRTLFGPRNLGEMLPLENISLSLTKILWWFVPRLSFMDPILLHPWIPLTAFIVLLLLLNRKAEWLNWLSMLSNPYLWPALTFSAIYFFGLAFTVVTADHLDLTSDRYYVILLPVILALVFCTLDVLLLSHLGLDRPQTRWALGIAIAVWLIYPVYSVQEYIRLALKVGEPSNYNIANSAYYREMSLVKAARPLLEQDPSAALYSNYLNIVWFIYQRPVTPLPYEDAGLPPEQRRMALQQAYPRWPPQNGYIIWFTPNQYHHIAPPEDLATLADLELLYSDRNGAIYFVRRRTAP